MADQCVGCSCQQAAKAPSGRRLLLATKVNHTVSTLRLLAIQSGAEVEVMAPGLLAVEGDDLDSMVAEASRQLSSVEASEVRCAVLEGSGPLSLSDVAALMGSPSLSTAGARLGYADLAVLFDDEDRCFHSVYQPIVDLPEGNAIAYEALLRAETPDGERVMPDEMFPAAHEAGWTHLLDRVGRTTALRDAGSWLGDELLFINFVPTSIYRPEVCLRTTERAAVEAGVRLDQLVFEVTEGHRVDDIGHLERVFDYYRSRNCRVALDDLGAGYSSLNMLVRLRPDIVKLDKELVQALPAPAADAVVSATVEMVHAYGGLVLAECVETAEQVDAAKALGVDLAQGWFFGKPERRNSSMSGHETGPSSAPARPELPDAAVRVPTPGTGPDGPAAGGGPRPATRMVERASTPDKAQQRR